MATARRDADRLSPEHAARFGVRANAIALVEQDEKSLPARATTTLGLSPADIDARLEAIGTRPWRKEQKLAGLAAWVALGAAR